MRRRTLWREVRMRIRNKKTGGVTPMLETRISFMTLNFKSYWYDSLKDFLNDWELLASSKNSAEKEEKCEN